jgi:hypothetical protein
MPASRGTLWLSLEGVEDVEAESSNLLQSSINGGGVLSGSGRASDRGKTGRVSICPRTKH